MFYACCLAFCIYASRHLRYHFSTDYHLRQLNNNKKEIAFHLPSAVAEVFFDLNEIISDSCHIKQDRTTHIPVDVLLVRRKHQKWQGVIIIIRFTPLIFAVLCPCRGFFLSEVNHVYLFHPDYFFLWYISPVCCCRVTDTHPILILTHFLPGLRSLLRPFFMSVNQVFSAIPPGFLLPALFKPLPLFLLPGI